MHFQRVDRVRWDARPTLLLSTIFVEFPQRLVNPRWIAGAKGDSRQESVPGRTDLFPDSSFFRIDLLVGPVQSDECHHAATAANTSQRFEGTGGTHHCNHPAIRRQLHRGYNGNGGPQLGGYTAEQMWAELLKNHYTSAYKDYTKYQNSDGASLMSGNTPSTCSGRRSAASP
jgi:hypothetical protein